MIIALVLGVVLGVFLYLSFGYSDYDKWFYRGAVFVCIILFICLSAGISLDNRIKIEKMKLFQSTTVKNYREVISQTSLLADEQKKSEWITGLQ